MEAVVWTSPTQEAELKQYIHWELTRALSAREALVQQWQRWLIQYRAPAKTGLKEFPWIGAADFELPITATDVDQFYAKFMQSLHATDLWVVQPMNEGWQEAAKPLQDFLAVLDRTVLKMFRVNKRAILEMVKLGTAIYEHGWLYETHDINTYNDDGQVIKATKVRSQPFVDHVRLTDFVLPPYSYAIQPDDQGGAPWVGKRVEMTPEKLRAMANATAPLFPNIGLQAAEEIINYEEKWQQPYDDTVQSLDYDHSARASTQNFDRSSAADAFRNVGGVVGSYVRKIELWEIHVRWAVSGTSPSDIVLLWHPPTQKIFRPIYNPYLHGQRPFEVIRFFPSDGFYGIGVCEQDEVFQAMESELHNYLYDNVLLSNAGMMAGKAGANIAPGEAFYPGKFIVTEGDPRAEIMAFKMGEVYPSLPNLIGMVQNGRRTRSGIGDLQTGNISGLPGRTTATSVQALLAEGNRRPDFTLKDMRHEGLSQLGLRIIQLCQQFIGSPVDIGAKRYLAMALDTLGLPEGQYAVEKLKTPLENAELGLGVEITASSANANQDLQKQQLMGLLTLSGQLYPQMLQMAQVAQQSPPGSLIQDTALKAFGGLSALFERTLEQHNVRDAERMVPTLPPEGQSLTGQAPAGPQPGAGPAGGGPPGAGGVPPLPAGAGTSLPPAQ